MVYPEKRILYSNLFYNESQIHHMDRQLLAMYSENEPTLSGPFVSIHSTTGRRAGNPTRRPPLLLLFRRPPRELVRESTDGVPAGAD